MTHPHPSDLPMIIPARQPSFAIISRATGGMRFLKRPYIPAPWCPRSWSGHRKPRQLRHVSGAPGKPVGWTS